VGYSNLEYFALVLLCVRGAGPVVDHLELVVGEVGQEGRHIPVKVPAAAYSIFYYLWLCEISSMINTVDQISRTPKEMEGCTSDKAGHRHQGN
jgi:hypothetical protein